MCQPKHRHMGEHGFKGRRAQYGQACEGLSRSHVVATVYSYPCYVRTALSERRTPRKNESSYVLYLVCPPQSSQAIG